MTDHERHYVQCARSLAAHLCAYAKERRDEDKRAITVAQSELCRIWKAEQKAPEEDK